MLLPHRHPPTLSTRVHTPDFQLPRPRFLPLGLEVTSSPEWEPQMVPDQPRSRADGSYCKYIFSPCPLRQEILRHESHTGFWFAQQDCTLAKHTGICLVTSPPLTASPPHVITTLLSQRSVSLPQKRITCKSLSQGLFHGHVWVCISICRHDYIDLYIYVDTHTHRYRHIHIQIHVHTDTTYIQISHRTASLSFLPKHIGYYT